MTPRWLKRPSARRASACPQREECAAQLAAAMAKAPAPTRSSLLEILGAMGGTKALEAMVAAVKGSDPELQETASKLLGEWRTIDAAPALLDLAKTAPGDKYRVRALRGYIRIARQFIMPDGPRAEMCQNALDTATRPDEQKLVLVILERYPNPDTFKVAAKAIQIPGVERGRHPRGSGHRPKARRRTGRTAGTVGHDRPGSDEGRNRQSRIRSRGRRKKTSPQSIQQQVRDLPLITLPSANYNASFGGDPAPGTVKAIESAVPDQWQGRRGVVCRKRRHHAAHAEVIVRRGRSNCRLDVQIGQIEVRHRRVDRRKLVATVVAGGRGRGCACRSCSPTRCSCRSKLSRPESCWSRRRC